MIRMFLSNRGKCCKNLVVTKDMLDKFNVSIYGTGEAGNAENDENVEEIVELLPPQICEEMAPGGSRGVNVII